MQPNSWALILGKHCMSIVKIKFNLHRFCSVRVANELGRGSSKAAKFSIAVTVLTSLAIGFLLFLFFLFYRERLAYIFTANNDVAAAVGDLSPLLAVSILLNSVQPVLSGINIFLQHLVSQSWFSESNLNFIFSWTTK